MTEAERRKEVGRGEKVMPGVWRLRLPLPWPGVPHGNAWAIAAGDGIVLVDTGVHGPGMFAHLERALAQVRLRIENVRLLVCTHAHSDHYGQAATVVERAGCELWMHPRYEHATAMAADPEAHFERRIEVGRQCGVPERALEAVRANRPTDSPYSGIVAPDRELVDGVEVATDLGTWTVHETPGHAPSHVVLHQPERRLLVSGDQVLGRVSLWFDIGWTPDPVGEFLGSCDVVDDLDSRLALPGHGRTFGDVPAHTQAARQELLERVAAVAAALAAAPEPLTAYAVTAAVYGERFTPLTGTWLMSETLGCLIHLAATGRAERLDGEPESWRGLQP